MNPNIADPNSIISQGANIMGLTPGGSQSPYTALSPSNTTSIAQTIAQGNQLAQPQAPTAPAGPQPNFLERLLPTIGGIGGGLLGGALDLGTGGLAFALDPALAGAGSAIGRGVENALMGQNPLQANDLASGAMGALGQGVGMGASKLLGMGGNALADFGAGAAAKAADATQAATDFAPYANVAKGADLQGMKSLFNDQLGTQDISPANVHNVTSMLTGGGANDTPDFINATKNQLVAGAGPVDISGISDTLKNSINNESNIAALGNAEARGSAGNGLYNSLMNKTMSLYGPEGAATVANGSPEASIDMTIHPTAVQDAIQSTRDSLDNLNTNTDTGQATANVLNDYRNALTKALGDSGGLNQIIKDYTVPAEDEAAFRAAVAAKGLPSQVADYGINTLNNAKNYTDITKAEVPLVKAGQLASAADKYQAGPGVVKEAQTAAKNGGLMSNPLKLAADAAGAYGVATGKPQDAIPAILLGVGGNPALMQTVGHGLSGLGGRIGSGILGALGIAGGNLPNDVAGPAGAGQQITNQGGDMNGGMNAGNLALEMAMETPMLGGGNGNLASLLPIAQADNAAQAATQGLTPYFNAAGGAQGPIGGLLNKLGAGMFTGGPAANYAAQEQQAAAAIARAESLGTGTQVNPSTVALPQITQNQTSAQQALSNIQTLMQKLMMVPGAAGS